MAQTSAERKLTAKGAQTRELIVAAAARLVFDRGVAGTSLEDVRNVAEVSNSQLYHYFRDKSELVRAVVRHQADARWDRWSASWPTSTRVRSSSWRKASDGGRTPSPSV